MAIKVTVPTSKNINTNIVSKKTSASVDTLKDVAVDGVSGGDTLVYNATTRKWEAKSPDQLAVTRIDGGTF
jgi:hypothetical protein